MSRSLRRVLAYGATLLTLAAPAASAGAQEFLVQTSPACGAGRWCPVTRFSILAPLATPLTLTSLRLVFDPSVAGFYNAGASLAYAGEDDYGLLSGLGKVSADESTLDIDFVDTGDPSFPGFPFTLNAGSVGYFDLMLSTYDLPAEAITFRFAATLDDGRRIGGVGRGIEVTSTVPEPATLLLTGGGLVLLGWAARRRRMRVQR